MPVSNELSRLLRFLHVGDLHITACGEQNHADFLAIVAEINAQIGDGIDFVLLPGDNADDGTAEQFRIVRNGLDRLDAPWHVIPGDHDFKPKSLAEFYRVLQARPLPYAEIVRGCLCIFLDSVSCGTGGPDFRLGETQLEWLRAQLATAREADRTAAVFMHTYPADLQEAGEDLAALLRQSAVALVDTGHTHYNELASDGRTVYAAVRSTGQIEEGDVGFALAAIDHGAVSWRFKSLHSSWPFVLITSPADRRLIIDPKSPRQVVPDQFELRASVWGKNVSAAAFRISDGAWRPMRPLSHGLYAATAYAADNTFELSVRATNGSGQSDVDVIEIARSLDKEDKSEIRALDAWPTRHLLGTKLGPNANGRKW